MWLIWFSASTINGTEAEDQAIRLEYQNTDKPAAFRFLMPLIGGSGQGCPLLRASNEYLLSIYSFLLSPSQVSQPGHSRLRPSNEHCFIVRVPGAKGCPGC